MEKKIKITIIDKKGKLNCPRGHKVGDIFVVEGGKTPCGLCGSAFTAIWPSVKSLINSEDKKLEGSNCCIDPDVLLEFKMELSEES